MQIDNTDLFLKLFYIQCKEIGNKKYCEESRELEKWQTEISPDIDLRKEKEDSWLNAMKTKIAFVKGRLNFSSKSATAANVHLMESLLDNWLKNNHTTVDIIYYLRNLLVSGVFYEF